MVQETTSKRYQRFNRMGAHQSKIERATKGEGLYVYRNRNKVGTLELPKPTASGVDVIPPNGEWQGDNYYMGLVRNNEAILVREIYSPQQQRDMEAQQMNESVQADQKLICDQPDVITDQGKIEHVVVPEQPVQPLNEQPGQTQEDERLLNEKPVEGVEILLD